MRAGLRWTLSQILLQKAALGLENPAAAILFMMPLMATVLAPLSLLTEAPLQVRVCLGDAESSLGEAKGSLGDAKSSLDDAKSSLGQACTRCRNGNAPGTVVERVSRLAAGFARLALLRHAAPRGGDAGRGVRGRAAGELPTAIQKLRIVALGVSGGRSLMGAVTRRPPVSLDAVVPPTGGYAYDVKVWDLSIVQGPFSVGPCQT
jgi:hypothetical protein